MEVTENWREEVYRLDQNGYTAERVFDVVGTVYPDVAIDATGVPPFGASHPRNGLLKATTFDPRRTAWDHWTVRVSYTTPTVGEATEPEDDPLDQPPKISWKKSFSSEPVDRDIHGNPILNSALDPTTQPPSRDIIIRQFDVTKNEPFYDASIAAPYENTINSASVTISGVGTFPAGTLRCLTITPASDYDRNSTHVPVVYSFEYRSDGWKLRIKDQGKRGWYTANGTPRVGEIVTVPYDDDGNEAEEGVAVSDDVPLNGKGAPLSAEFKLTVKEKQDGVSLAGPPTGAEIESQPDAVFLKYDNYEVADHNVLALSY